MLWLPTNLLLRLRKRALVRTDTVQCIIEDLKLFKKSLIHSSRHIIINTDGEEEDKKKNVSRMVRGHWVTDICYDCLEL